MDPFLQKMVMIFTACGMIVLGVFLPDVAAKNLLFVTAGVIFGGATIRRPEDLAPSTGRGDT